jgi:hypothetical protein
MKKICLFMSALMFCAAFSSAQKPTAPSQFTDTLNNAEYKIKDFNMLKAGVSDFKLNMARPASGLTPEIAPEIKDAFMQFSADPAGVHGKPYYAIMANYLAKIAKEKNILKGEISFMDGKQFAEKYKNAEQYDFYTQGWEWSGGKPAFHKVNNVTNSAVVKHVQLMLLTDGKPAISISFIEHVRRDGPIIYVHTWDMSFLLSPDGKTKTQLWSTNVADESDDAAHAALEEPLIKAGSSFYYSVPAGYRPM